MTDTILARCEVMGLRLTGQRRAVVKVLEGSSDHPDIQQVYDRALHLDANISIATVYRTVKLLEEVGILDKLDFGDGVTRYEDADREHHDHLIDLKSGKVIEFMDKDLEELQNKIAKRLGFELRGHRLELFGVPIDNSKDNDNS